MYYLYIISVIMDPIIIGLLPFIFLYKTGRKIYKKKIYYVAAFLLLVMIIPTVVFIFRNDFISMFVIAATFILIGQFLFSKGKGALFYQIVYIIGLYASQILNSVIVQSIYTSVGTMSLDPYSFTLIGCIIKDFIEVLYTLIMIQVSHVWYQTDQRLSKWQLVGLIAIPVYSILVLYSMLLTGEVFFMRYGFWLLIIHTIVLLAIDIYCVYVFYQFSVKRAMEEKIALMDIQNKMQCDYYTTMDKRLDETKKVIHDIKNHLSVIEQLYENNDRTSGQAYIEQVREMMDALGMQYYTENKLLNMIFNDKINKALQQNISVTAKAYHMPLEFMASLDITTIFSNLLDNAIEASAKSSEHWIEIRSEVYNEMLMIKISNSTDGDENSSAGSGIEQENHQGIGLVNVKKAVEKYQGSLDIHNENKVFTAMMMFPKQVKRT